MPQQEIELATQRLAQAIRESEEYILYSGLKDAVMSDETNKTLLKEYQKAQTVLQMAAMAGKDADEDTVQRFSQLWLPMNNQVAQYLLAASGKSWLGRVQPPGGGRRAGVELPGIGNGSQA